MTDPLPNEVKFIRASTSGHRPGSCDARAGTVTWDLGNLRRDRTVIVKIVVKNVEAGRYTNRASVTHNHHGAPSLRQPGRGPREVDPKLTAATRGA
jgi:hypothetical protein